MFGFLKKMVSDSEDKSILKESVEPKSNSVSNNKDEELAAVIAAAIAASYNEELVAVIAAAVSASIGVGIPDIKIRSIKRVPQTSTPWASMGKMEQLFSKLN